MGWSPKDAAKKFSKLAQQAFTKKLRLRIPVVKYFVEYFCTFRYQSTGIENALKAAFGDAFLFGQSKRDTSSYRGDDVKVGVVSCIEGRDQPCLIANYNRNPMEGSKNGKYRRYIPTNQKLRFILQPTVCSERISRKTTSKPGRRM